MTLVSQKSVFFEVFQGVAHGEKISITVTWGATHRGIFSRTLAQNENGRTYSMRVRGLGSGFGKGAVKMQGFGNGPCRTVTRGFGRIGFDRDRCNQNWQKLAIFTTARLQLTMKY